MLASLSTEVAIVGAGLAGATAARELHDAGRQVLLLEKARGVGGRMSNRRVTIDETGIAAAAQFDHGAQYFTARDPRFLQWLAPFQDRKLVLPWRARIGSFDVSGFSSKNAEAIDRYVASPGQNALVKALVEGLPLQLSTTVAQIQRHAECWALMNAQGELLVRARKLLLCVPAPQAAKLLAEHAGRARSFAEQTVMQPCWAAMLAFSTPLKLPFDAAFVNTGKLSWIARDSSKPGRTGGKESWVLHATAQWSNAHLEDEADSVLAALVAEFAALLKLVGMQEDIAQLLCYRNAHRWRYALGARADQSSTFFFDATNHLGIAGDWCAGGRVEGAFLSGLTLARRLLQG